MVIYTWSTQRRSKYDHLCSSNPQHKEDPITQLSHWVESVWNKVFTITTVIILIVSNIHLVAQEAQWDESSPTNDGQAGESWESDDFWSPNPQLAVGNKAVGWILPTKVRPEKVGSGAAEPRMLWSKSSVFSQGEREEGGGGGKRNTARAPAICSLSLESSQGVEV